MDNKILITINKSVLVIINWTANVKYQPAYTSCWCHQSTTFNLSMQKQKSCIKNRREAELWVWSAVPELQWEWPYPEWYQPQGLCRRKRLHQPGSGALLHQCYWFPQFWEEERACHTGLLLPGGQDSPVWTRILQRAASDLMCFSYLTLQVCRAAIPQLQASRAHKERGNDSAALMAGSTCWACVMLGFYKSLPKNGGPSLLLCHTVQLQMDTENWFYYQNYLNSECFKGSAAHEIHVFWCIFTYPTGKSKHT